MDNNFENKKVMSSKEIYNLYISYVKAGYRDLSSAMEKLEKEYPDNGTMWYCLAHHYVKFWGFDEKKMAEDIEVLKELNKNPSAYDFSLYDDDIYLNISNKSYLIDYNPSYFLFKKDCETAIIMAEQIATEEDKELCKDIILETEERMKEYLSLAKEYNEVLKLTIKNCKLCDEKNEEEREIRKAEFYIKNKKRGWNIDINWGIVFPIVLFLAFVAWIVIVNIVN